MSNIHAELEAQCIRHGLGHVLTEWPFDVEPSSVIDKLESFGFESVNDDSILPWEVYEHYSGQELSEEIHNIALTHRLVAINAIKSVISEVVGVQQDTNAGYSSDYKRGWDDACEVILKKLKVSYEHLDPRPIG